MDRPKTRFIIVDDDKDVRYFMRRVIQRQFTRAEVAEAGDGAEALKLFEATGPDLMVIDHNLPSLSGPDLVRELRTRDPMMPIVMVSHFPAAQAEAMEAGANSFVSKDELMPSLGDHLIKLLTPGGAGPGTAAPVD
jgi:two-component system invasion response regulator UvrY